MNIQVKMQEIFGVEITPDAVEFYQALRELCPRTWEQTVYWKDGRNGNRVVKSKAYPKRVMLMEYLRDRNLIKRNPDPPPNGRHEFVDMKFGFSKIRSLYFRSKKTAEEFFAEADILRI